MRRALLATLLLAMSVGSQAKADVVDIDFDFSNSVISALNGSLLIPPAGSINSSSATFRFDAAPTLSLVTAGPASLQNLTIDATVDALIGGVVAVDGTIAGSQVGGVAGTLTGGLGQVVFGGNLALDLSVFLNCSPAILCAGVGTFPISITGTQTIGALATIPINSINNIGNATISASIVITLGGVPATLQLVGNEVARQQVPEPNTAALVGLGALALSGAGWVRRRRR